MSLNNEQIETLVKMIATVSPDELDCDGCSRQIAEFAEFHLLGKTLEQSQEAVKRHLENCLCCQLEFNSLLEALEYAEEEHSDA